MGKAWLPLLRCSSRLRVGITGRCSSQLQRETLVLISVTAGDVLIHDRVNHRPHGGRRGHGHGVIPLGRGKANRRS
jgi:hypothetical protein